MGRPMNFEYPRERAIRFPHKVEIGGYSVRFSNSGDVLWDCGTEVSSRDVKEIYEKSQKIQAFTKEDCLRRVAKNVCKKQDDDYYAIASGGTELNVSDEVKKKGLSEVKKTLEPFGLKIFTLKSKSFTNDSFTKTYREA